MKVFKFVVVEKKKDFENLDVYIIYTSGILGLPQIGSKEKT